MIDLATIKNFFKKNYKVILFLVIFFGVCLTYNINNPTLNYVLGRGTTLKYSIPNKNTDIDQKIKQLKINYADVHQITDENGTFNNEEKFYTTLFVRVPIIIKKENNEEINEISDFIFENEKGSKLVNIYSVQKYNNPYGSFLTFLGILLVSSFIHLILLYLFFDKSFSLEKIKNCVTQFLIGRKNWVLDLFKNTKEKGPLYLLKKLLLDDTEDKKEEEKGSDVVKEIISTILFVIICVVVIKYFIGELRWIPSGSMRPTILEKDRVFVEKLKYPTKEIERGDILVFYPPEVELSNAPLAVIARLTGIFCNDIAFIKRVVGMPNDKFEIKVDKKTDQYFVYINDIPLYEPYISTKDNWTPCNESMFCGPFVIPENNYFMMGDNRNNSQDSRFWGFLDKKRVIGRANFMFFPINRINVLRDKYAILHKTISKNGIVEDKYIYDRY